MEQKILILGANGMLGHDLAEVFAADKPLLWDQADLDITDEAEVQEKLDLLKPTLVINAAAYTNVDGAETDPDLAFAVNAKAVGYLASACQKNQAIFVHYSTEYVFDGTAQNGYAEDALVCPINVYGQSKAEGERLLMQNCDMYYLIRTSWLYGKAPQVGKPRGLNFVETMLKLASEKDSLNIVNDQFGKPTYARDLAKKTKELVSEMAKCGIYHLTNEAASGKISWYDFAAEIFRQKNVNIDLKPISSDQYQQAAKRPQYSVLLNTKTGPLRPWQEALGEYLTQ